MKWTDLTARATFFLSLVIFSVSAIAEAPRNLILLIGDGMGPAQVKAYRMYADDPSTEVIDPLAIDPLMVGSVATDSIQLECGDGQTTDCARVPFATTDSASSATAYATGRDTLVGRISMDLAGADMQTLLEKAKMRGKGTGMVVTSEVTHATPAAFAAHVAHRDQKVDIADQYFDRKWSGESMIDVLLGGGVDGLQRPDRDLVAEFSQAGYQIAFDRQQLLAMDGNRLLGLFAPEGLPRAWDRPGSTPSLAEMTNIALTTLNRNPAGFFLLIEGSQIDWAAHRNSVPGVISEMEEFMAAIRLALDFARGQKDTLVIVTADHETGGMTLGRDDIYRWNPKPLHGVTRTPKNMAADFLESDRSLSSIVSVSVNFELTEVERWSLDAAEREDDDARRAIAALFNQRTVTGWTSPGHTGVDVPLYAYGPGRERFYGVMPNEALGQMMWNVFFPGEP